MVPILYYAACAVASVGLLLLTKPRGSRRRVGISILGLAGVAWILVLAAREATADVPGLVGVGCMALCAFVAIAAAARVITHPRPVFSALYFVLVVVSSAAMYVLLSAEFVAFSLIIVYAGAILITYLFVLMLAQQAPGDTQGADAIGYDRIPREPAGAVFAGFVIVAALGGSIFSPAPAQSNVLDQRASIRQGWMDLAAMPKFLLARARSVDPTVTALAPALADAEGLPSVEPQIDGSARVMVLRAGSPAAAALSLPPSLLPDNTSRVGMALVTRFPVSLELAGVILLMAMLGAVVLARRQIELADDERRAHAGLPRHAESPVEGAP